MANKISVIIDASVDKAVSGLKGFRASINDADGAVGKFKAGSAAAFGAIKEHAATMALAAGAALVTFAAKGIAAFTDLSLEAGKFRDVSGATLDEASRWIAVGDDIGVSGDTISAAWNKMNIAIGAGKPLLAEYGIELKKTADGQTDANATFLNAIDTINGIQDPTKKAELAAATFGKGWTGMSELIEQGSETITAAMAKVSEAQIIDDAEIAKAKKYRESMDKLGDSVKDLAMNVGEELTPAVSVAADTLATIAPAAGKMAKFVGGQFVKIADEAYAMGKQLAEMADALPFVEIVGLAEGIEHTSYEFEQLQRHVDDNIASWEQGVSTMEEFEAKLRAMGLSQDEINLAMKASKLSLDKSTEATEGATDATEDFTDATDASTLATDMASFAIDAKKRADDAAADAIEEATRKMEEHTRALEEQTQATDELFGAKQALVGGDIAVRDSQRDAAEAVAALTALTDEGKTGTEEYGVAQDGAAQSLLDAASAAADYQIAQAEANGESVSGESKTNIFKNKLIELAQTLAPGSPLLAQILGYIDALGKIPTNIDTRVTLHGGDLIGGVNGRRAAGGPVGAGGTYLVGEQGPELLTMGAGSGHITPNGALGGSGGGGGLTVNINGGLIDQRTIEQIAREWDRWKRGLS